MPAGQLVISAGTIDLGANLASGSIDLANAGGQPLDWSIGGTATPFIWSTTAGTLQPGATFEVQLGIDRTGLPEGDIVRSFAVVSSAEGSTQLTALASVEHAPTVTIVGHELVGAVPDPVGPDHGLRRRRVGDQRRRAELDRSRRRRLDGDDPQRGQLDREPHTTGRQRHLDLGRDRHRRPRQHRHRRCPVRRLRLLNHQIADIRPDPRTTIEGLARRKGTPLMKLSNVRLTRVAATLALAGLALTACGGDDEEAGDDTAAATADDGAAATADEAEETAAEEPTAEGDEGDDDGGETITVDDVGDIPQECIDQFGDLMEQIEPIVEDIDWQSATMADFEAISTQLDRDLGRRRRRG